MRLHSKLYFVPVWILFCMPVHAATKTKNVVLVMTDGLRWEEFFNGADKLLMNAANGVANEKLALQQYWREDLVARRKALLPFLCEVVGAKGQIFGNRSNTNSI